MRPDVRTLDVDQVAELLNAAPRPGDVEVHQPASAPAPAADGGLLATSVTDRQQLKELLDSGDVEVQAILAVRVQPRTKPRPPVTGTLTRRPSPRRVTREVPAPAPSPQRAPAGAIEPAREPARHQIRRHRRRRRRTTVILGAVAAEVALFATAATAGYVFAAAITTVLVTIACVIGTLMVLAVAGPLLLSIVTGARCPCPCTCC